MKGSLIQTLLATDDHRYVRNVYYTWSPLAILKYTLDVARVAELIFNKLIRRWLNSSKI